MEKIKFGNSSIEIDNLANQVLSGEKVATSSLLDFYSQGLKNRSKVGDHFSILNSSDEEVAIVRVEKIAVIKFGDITETFAIEEGDGSLENWLTIHRPYYTKLLIQIGKELRQDTLLVCEWFKVIKAYPSKIQSIALQFNNCINNVNIEGLADLMTEDHVFIDMDNNRIEGLSSCISIAWEPLFKLFPDYRNTFEKVISKEASTVVMQGYSICADRKLNNLQAIWLAKVNEEKVSLWHIYPDSKESRDMFGFK